MKKVTLAFYGDSQHGWLKCSRKLIVDLGIADSITRYSYQQGSNVFLEEDSDAPKLLDALKARGIALKVRERVAKSRSSKIRNYPSYCIGA